jgi:hypothetical protein
MVELRRGTHALMLLSILARALFALSDKGDFVGRDHGRLP